VQLSQYSDRLRAGRPELDSRQVQRFFSFRNSVQTGSGYHPASCQKTTEGFSLGLKQPWREADLSHPSRAEVKNTWSYTSTFPYFLVLWYLVKRGDNFTLS
jgi:hypothetical protein